MTQVKGTVDVMMLSLLAMCLAAAAGCRSQSGQEDVHMPTADVLRASSWRLAEMEGQALPETSNITLELARDGKVAGFAGVNRYFGTYLSDAPGQIRFSPLGSTRRAGLPEAMRRENDFLAAMQRVAAYHMRDDTLEMTDGQNPEPLLVWRRADRGS